MATKRLKANGRWEFVVKRSKLLDKPFYFYCDTEEEGDHYCARLEALLDKGIVPEELKGGAPQFESLAELVRGYLTENSVPLSDIKVLNVIYARDGATQVKVLTYDWVTKWIGRMKSERNLSPTTIRHYVGALARCFDWAGNKNVPTLVQNPIRQLPKRYAQYTKLDTETAQAHDEEHEKREDEERNRRLEHGEEERIRAIMDRAKPANKQRPLTLKYQAATKLIFDLALETAMRLREIYTLTVDQVNLEKRTVFLDKTKNGHKRQVPLSSVALAKIVEYYEHVDSGSGKMAGYSIKESSGRLFPWWNGDLDGDYLASVTVAFSGRYRSIFVAAEVPDFRFHDLRHEATSRLFERTSLSDFEIMKITGHSSTRMLARYGNLRGSTLADKLW